MSDSRPPFDPFGPPQEGTGLPPSPPVADAWAAPGSGPVWPPAQAANPYAAPPSPPAGGPYHAPPAAPANPYAAPPSAPAGSYGGPYAGQYGGQFGSPYAGYPGSFGGPTPTPPPQPTTNTRRHNQLAFIGGLLVATLLIAAVVLVHNGLNSGSTTNTQAGSPITIPPPAGSGGGAAGNGSSAAGSGSTGSSGAAGAGSGSALSTEAVTAAVEPGVVDIDTRLGYQSAAAAGTGMILTSNGLVLTNNHVIDGATSITATVVGTGRTYTASVVGTDVSQDIAVLRLSGASGLTPVPLGDSSTVSSGDKVVAIGNAGGTGGSPTVVTGTVTDLNQSITASDENGSNAEQLTGLIVTNAPIVAGDSGGPLSNAQGKVIGIDTAASANNQYMSANSTGFAIPINHALAIAKQIEAGNETDTIHIGATGFLGIAMAPADSGTGAGSGASSGLGSGSGSSADDPATVSTVIAGSPADKAGIVAGDTITAFDGTSVSTAQALQTLTHRRHPGDQVSISWADTSGQSHQATITLASGPAA